MDGVTSGALQECGHVISGDGGLSWRKQPVLPRWERPQGETVQPQGWACRRLAPESASSILAPGLEMPSGTASTPLSSYFSSVKMG